MPFRFVYKPNRVLKNIAKFNLRFFTQKYPPPQIDILRLMCMYLSVIATIFKRISIFWKKFFLLDVYLSIVVLFVY